MTEKKPPLRVGLAGLGAVGLEVAKRLIAGVPGLTLAAVAVRDEAKARRALPELGAVAFKPATALADDCDVVVECLPPALFRDIAISAIDKGRIFMPLSVAQLLDNWDLVARARENRRAHFAADRRAHRPRRRARRRRRHHPFGQDDHAQAARRPRRRALSARAQDFRQRPESAAESVRRHGARWRARLSRQRQRGGSAQPRRHWPRPHATGNLGRPHHHAQHPPHRGRRRRRALLHDHRGHPVGEPAHRPHRAAVDRSPRCARWCRSSRSGLSATRAGKSCGDRRSRRARRRSSSPADGRGKLPVPSAS